MEGGTFTKKRKLNGSLSVIEHKNECSPISLQRILQDQAPETSEIGAGAHDLYNYSACVQDDSQQGSTTLDNYVRGRHHLDFDSAATLQIHGSHNDRCSTASDGNIEHGSRQFELDGTESCGREEI